MERVMFVEVGQSMEKLQCQVRTGCTWESTETLKNQWLATLTHINIKRIQSSQFQTDLENPNVCVLQIDFAISYCRVSRWGTECTTE